jgi:hypothetical protein
MAIDFYSSIDLNKCELQNAALQNLPSHPSTPVEGQVYYNTGDDQIKLYANSEWVALASGSVSSAADDITTGDGAVSIATSSGNVTIDSQAAGLILDGHTGITLQNASGDILIDSAADIVLDAAGNDFSFKSADTEFLRVTNSTGDAIIKPIVDAKDIIFQQRDGTEVARIEDNGTFNVVAGKLAINGTAITSTAAELNILAGVTSTAAELNILAGVNTSAAELNYVEGVTSNIQDQLDDKAPLASPTFTGTANASNLTVSGTLTGTLTGNAATVTTNANLTGHITSSGNAAVLGSFTVAQLSAAISNASISGNNTGDQTTVSGSSGTVTSIGNLTGDVTSVNRATTIAPAAVHHAMLHDDIISGQGELTGVIDDTDEFLVSDAGTVKRADFSVVRDAVFADISGDGTIAAGGALTVTQSAGDFTVTGDLIVSGDTVTVNTANLLVEDPLIGLASGNGANSVDIGIWGKYTATGAKYTGLFRDASDSDMWKLFATTGGTHEAPGTGTTINTTSGFTYANLTLATLTGDVTGNLTGDVTGNADTATTLQTARTIAISGDITGTATSFNGGADISISSAITAGAIVNADISASAGIVDTKLATIGTAGKVSNSATTATSANTASAIVARDASNNFSAGTITATLTGNADTVTTNANLTGHITSSGNAAVLGSFTSAQLSAALTDETGSGAAVFATSPTLVTPALGTPVSGDLSGCTVASASAKGVVELATAAEVIAGTETAVVITPDTLAAKSVVAEIEASSLIDSLSATITHNLGTRDVIVQMYGADSDQTVYADVFRTTDDLSTSSEDVITIDFSKAPLENIRVLITSIEGATTGTIAYT